MMASSAAAGALAYAAGEVHSERSQALSNSGLRTRGARDSSLSENGDGTACIVFASLAAEQAVGLDGVAKQDTPTRERTALFLTE